MALDLELAERIVASSPLPTRPSILADLMAEQARDEPSVPRIVDLIQREPMVAAAVLKTVNSVSFGLSQRTSSVQHAVALLGMKNICTLITGFAVRHSLGALSHGALDEFWDDVTMVALIASGISRRTGLSSSDAAYSFVLFRDCGIPLMLREFKNYPATFSYASEHPEEALPEVEQSFHGTSHTALGYLLATSWLLPDAHIKGVAHHHDMHLFGPPEAADPSEPALPTETLNLIALARLADHIFHRTQFLNPDPVWPLWADTTLAYLGLDTASYERICEEIEAEINLPEGY